MLVALFLLLIVAPLVELYVAIQVAQVIGGWNTIAVLLLVGAFGAWLLRRQGAATLRRGQRALAEGRMPDRELLDGLFLAIAAALMIAPGFVSDAVGILLLLPPVRALLRPMVTRRFGRGGGTTMRTAGGTTFVGTFRVPRGGGFHETSGRERPDDPDERRPLRP